MKVGLFSKHSVGWIFDRGQENSAQAEKSLNGGKNTSGLIFISRSNILAGSEGLSAFRDDVAQRFHQIGIGGEYLLHRGMANLQHFGFLERDHIRGSGFAREQSHLTKESSFAE